jgi:hypothetical protein
VRNERESVGRGDHEIGITAIEGDAGDQGVFAEDEVAAAAGGAVVAMTAMPAETDALPGFKEWHIGSDFIDDAGNFMAGDTGILDSRKEAQFCKNIAVAYPTGLNANAYVAGAGGGKSSLNEFKIAARRDNLAGATRDGRHICLLLRCWMKKIQERCFH